MHVVRQTNLKRENDRNERKPLPSPLRKLISADQACTPHKDIPPFSSLADSKFSQ